MRIARVFPRRTKATPADELSFIGDVPLLRPEADEVRVSATFTWDLPLAERLVSSWGRFYPTTLGGPATGMRGEDFEPGLYLKHGYTITSRGCPNDCWFCSVPKREGATRELPIRDGWNVLDDNILATSREHFLAVCAMLKQQVHPAEFTGGLEAARLTPWHADLLASVKLSHLFLAYDTPDDWEPLVEATRLLQSALPHAKSAHKLRCYCLIGYPRDTLADAEKRLRSAVKLGLMPMAMLYRNERGGVWSDWSKFQRSWAAPQAVGATMRDAR